VTAVDPTNEGLGNALFAKSISDVNGDALKLAHYESANLPTTPRTLIVPVDSAANTLQVSLNTFGGTLKLYAPDGHEVAADANVTVGTALNSISYDVAAPTIGDWRIEITPNADAAGIPYTLSANIGGGPTFTNLQYRFQAEIGRAMHEYSPEVIGTPPAAPLRVQVSLYPTVTQASLQYMSTDGAVLSETPMNEAAPGEWQTIATPPQQAHRVRVVGIDTGGKAFERMLPGEQDKSEVTGGLFRVTPLGPLTAAPGQTTKMRFLIQNFGTDDTYTTELDSSSVGSPTFTNGSGTLAGQTEGVVEMSVPIPAGYTGSATDAVNLTVKSPKTSIPLSVPVVLSAPAPTVQTSYTAPTATGTGNATATISGGSESCGFTAAQFVTVSNALVGVAFPHGLFDFALGGCTPGSTVTVNITYPSALPAGAQYWKYGVAAGNVAAHWYSIPATLAGNTGTFSITDGGLGDDDLTANGSIVDPGGPGVPVPPPTGATPTAIPTLSEWSLLLLAGLLGLAGMAMGRRRYFMR
jgi:hypothetical protein